MMDSAVPQQSPFNPQLLLERLRLQQAGGAQRVNPVPAAVSAADKQKIAAPSSSSSAASNNISSNRADDISYIMQQQQQQQLQPYLNPFRQKFDFEAPSIYGSQSDNHSYGTDLSQNDTFYNVFRNISQNLNSDKSTFAATFASKASAVSETDYRNTNDNIGASLFNEPEPLIHSESIEELNAKLQNTLLELSEDLRLSNQKNIELQIENESLEYKYMKLKFKTDDTIAELRGRIAAYALGRVPPSTGNAHVFAESADDMAEDNDSATYPASYSGTDNSLNNCSYSEPTFSELMRRTGQREFIGDDYFGSILRKKEHRGRSPAGYKKAGAGRIAMTLSARSVSPSNTVSSLNESGGSDGNNHNKAPIVGNSDRGTKEAKPDVVIDIYPSLRLNESIAHVANSSGIKDKRMSVWSSDRRKSLNSWLTEEDEVVVDVDLTTELD